MEDDIRFDEVVTPHAELVRLGSEVQLLADSHNALDVTAALRGEVRRLKASNAALQTSFQTLKRHTDDLEADNEAQCNQIQSLGQNTALRLKMQRDQAKLDTREDVVEAQKAQLAILQTSLGTEQSRFKLLQKEHLLEKEAGQQRARQRDTLELELAKQQKLLLAAKGELAKVRAQAKRSQLSSERLQEANAALRTELQTACKDNGKLQEQARALEAYCRALCGPSLRQQNVTVPQGFSLAEQMNNASLLQEISPHLAQQIKQASDPETHDEGSESTEAEGLVVEFGFVPHPGLDKGGIGKVEARRDESVDNGSDDPLGQANDVDNANASADHAGNDVEAEWSSTDSTASLHGAVHPTLVRLRQEWEEELQRKFDARMIARSQADQAWEQKQQQRRRLDQQWERKQRLKKTRETRHKASKDRVQAAHHYGARSRHQAAESEWKKKLLLRSKEWVALQQQQQQQHDKALAACKTKLRRLQARLVDTQRQWEAKEIVWHRTKLKLIAKQNTTSSSRLRPHPRKHGSTT